MFVNLRSFYPVNDNILTLKNYIMKHSTLLAMALVALFTPAYAQTARVKYLSTSMQTLNVEALQQTEQPVQVNRILFAGYNSICLPMTLDGAQLQQAAEGVRVERFVAMQQEGNTLNLFFVDCTDEGIEAGVPYLICSPKTQNLRARSTDCELVSTTLHNVTLSDSQGNRVSFGSSWEAVQSEGRYGIPAKQDAEVLESILTRTNGDQTFLPTRCGFNWQAQAPAATALKIKHVSASDIDAIKTMKGVATLVNVYDVNGTLVRKQVSANEATQSLPRGVYVVGTEKVVVR